MTVTPAYSTVTLDAPLWLLWIACGGVLLGTYAVWKRSRSALTNAEIAFVVAAWAATEPSVKSVWMYGSRFRGDNRQDSDVDIAIELVERGQERLETIMDNLDRWRRDLSRRLGIKAHIEPCDPEIAGNVWRFLDGGSLLVYEQP